MISSPIRFLQFAMACTLTTVIHSHCLASPDGLNCFWCGSSSITVSPQRPSALDHVTITVDGVRGSSPVSVFSYGVSVLGNVITVNAQVLQSGFAVPGTYSFTADAGQLPAGPYTIQYFAQTADVRPPFTTPPELESSSNFVVVAVPLPSTIPTLDTKSLLLLGVIIGLSSLLGTRSLRPRNYSRIRDKLSK